MSSEITLVTLVVRDYDEAIAFYVNALGFTLIEDTPIDETKRWVVVGPSDGKGTSLLLARAATIAQQRIGDQTGGRVFLFLHTHDFASRMSGCGPLASSLSARLARSLMEPSPCSRVAR